MFPRVKIFLFSHYSSHLQPVLGSVPSPVLHDTTLSRLPRRPKLSRQVPGCFRESARSAAVLQPHGTDRTHQTACPHSPGGRLHHSGRTGTIPGTLHVHITGLHTMLEHSEVHMTTVSF